LHDGTPAGQSSPHSISDYTSAQLADIICYLRFTVKGVAQAVNPDDVE
jgi:hypothetical protein